MSATPGPWTNKEHSTFVWSKDGNVCACGDPRARATVGYTECEVGTEALSEAVANARLIAAAPEMLTMLKRCEAMVSEGAGPPNWDYMREVIAKAEGRTNA